MSYDDLKTTLDGITHTTFKETTIAYGLLESDEEWDQCLSEAAVSFMPQQLHSLFVTILIFGEPAKPTVLWEKYKEIMEEDIFWDVLSLTHIVDTQKRLHADNKVLLLLQEELEGMGTCLEKFGLPTPNMENRVQTICKVILEEMFDPEMQRENSSTKCNMFNQDQQYGFCAIMKAVSDDNHTERLFFINAPGGYGKAFLIEVLLATVRGLGKIALAVASSGIAAELLEGGRTAHSWFKIPIPIHETSVCSISLQSPDAKLIQQTSLIMWDEIMMSHVDQIDCLDRSL